jgi:DNA-binding protein YbaB
MDPLRKYAIQSNILQIEETFRDAIIKAHEERYRKLRDELAKLMSDASVASQIPPAFSGATMLDSSDAK